MLCEKVDGRGWGGEHDDGGYYGPGMLMFEIIIIVAIVAFWVWLFQVMDGASYLAWQQTTIPVAPLHSAAATDVRKRKNFSAGAEAGD
jgi:hypothetical protein